MKAIADFFYIGGYAWYVWGSYGVCLVFIIAEVILLKRGHKTLKSRLSRIARLDNSDND